MQKISPDSSRSGSAALALFLCLSLTACKMTNKTPDVLPRNQSLPLFKPHVASFICEVEATKVPSIDAQADVWFHEARALDNPEIYYGDRDYKKIVQLTRQAADRHHWKAMLNLASLYLQGFDPPHGTEDAVQLVEQAMRLGIPAAYDRMGTYYMNGTGVNRDATRAYAFWQKAAEMGNPDAMAYLAGQMTAGRDSGPGHWSNIPVATKMLECAFAQGYGPAAYNLHFIYIDTRESDGKWLDSSTRETKARTLKIMHEGIKLGCEECARDLSSEFDRPVDLSDTYVPHVDKARGERYLVLTEALGFDPSTRFPNLDKVVPLPPAPLPPWNGDRDTLLHAAMGVAPPQKTKDIPSASNHDRHFVHPDYALQRTGYTTDALSEVSCQ